MEQKRKWDNEERNRYYGKRIGDLVEERAGGCVIRGIVEEYGFGDNNRLYLRREDDTRPSEDLVYEDCIPVVAEYCVIIEKVEDRLAKSSSDPDLITDKKF